MIEFINLYNRWYIIPTLSCSYDKDVHGKFYYFYIELCWLNKAICINLIKEK